MKKFDLTLTFDALNWQKGVGSSVYYQKCEFILFVFSLIQLSFYVFQVSKEKNHSTLIADSSHAEEFSSYNVTCTPHIKTCPNSSPGNLIAKLPEGEEHKVVCVFEHLPVSIQIESEFDIFNSLEINSRDYLDQFALFFHIAYGRQ